MKRIAFALGAIAVFASAPVLAQVVITKTYTADADFDQGLLLNLNHDSPNANQLQVSTGIMPFPFLNAIFDGGLVIRIDTNTGRVVGAYHTAPAEMWRYAANIAVDRAGNVWVINSKEYGLVDGEPRGSVVRIGLVMGGTRVDQAGNPAPLGQYMKPPFQYNTCVDRDGDGLVKTWNGGVPMPWTNLNGADTNGGVSTAEDECIISYTRTWVLGNDNAQGVLLADLSGDVWVGGYNSLGRRHEKLSGVTGQPVPHTQFDISRGGLGGTIDRLGNLWFLGPMMRLMPYSTPPPVGTFHMWDYPAYDWAGAQIMALDSLTGNLLVGHSQAIFEVDTDGNQLSKSVVQNNVYANLAVDGSGKIWLGEWHHVNQYRRNPNNLSQFELVGRVRVIPDYYHVGLAGTAVDSNGKIWATTVWPPAAVRIDPALAGGVGAVDLRVEVADGGSLGGGLDLTGWRVYTALGPTGIWNVVHDSLATGTQWGRFFWNAIVPPGAGLMARVRAADERVDLSKKAFVDVANNGSVCGMGVNGRYLEIQVSLNRPPGGGASPVLQDFTVNGCTALPDTIAPVVTNMAATPNPVAVNEPVTLSATLSDDGGSNLAAAEYSIGGMPPVFLASASGTSAQVSAGIPPFTTTGVYDVCTRGRDDAGNLGAYECLFLPVYDPTGGFVTGGGWISSPAGAYAPNPALTGKATFGFVSKYKHGANVPSGDTQFAFHVANLIFKSTSYQWLVVAGPKAQFKGDGTINGSGAYRFMLTAIDGQEKGGGGVDKFRIKIWDDLSGQIVYDNQKGANDNSDAATPLGGGSIVIHK